MTSIKADLSVCQGYANCVMAAGEYFDIDDDALVVILKDDVPPVDRKRVDEAARSCPVSALTLVDD